MATRPSSRTRWSRRIVARRGWVIGVWAVLALVLIPLATRAGNVLEVGARVHGSESAEVAEQLRERFRSPYAETAVLVARGIPDPGTAAGRAALAEILVALEPVPGVASTRSYADGADPLFRSPGGRGTFVLVGIDPDAAEPGEVVARIRDAIAPVRAELGERYPGSSLRLTGEAATAADLRTASARDARRSELRVLPIALGLLLFAFGTVVAAVVPVVTGVLAIALALGVASLLAIAFPLSILLQNVVSMLGLGLGIDYALLTVSRFREALDEGASPEDAAAFAAERAGKTIAVSGLSVGIGFAALAFVPVTELQSFAVGGLAVVVVSVMLANTLLPAVLSRLGHRIDTGRLRRTGRTSPAARRWRRLARVAVRRPILVLLLGGVPAVALALQSFRLDARTPDREPLPSGVEAAAALEDLDELGRGGLVHRLQLIVELPRGVTVSDELGWRALARASDTLAADPRAARVLSLPAAVPAGVGPAALERAPKLARPLVSADARAMLVEIVPRETLSRAEVSDWAVELRGVSGAELTGLAGTEILVGGRPASSADFERALLGYAGVVLAFVLGATFLALLVAFRSILVPLKAVILNLISVGAGLGAVVLVFQDGFGAALIGLAEPIDAVFPAIPLLAFCIVFGLSMDYEVFLVGRVAEARRAGASEREAVEIGLARTGGVITNAAAIMIVVFAGFVFGQFLLIKILGFALAASVLVDATLVRLAIAPALLRLGGRWNWWPGTRRSGTRGRPESRTGEPRDEERPGAG